MKKIILLALIVFAFTTATTAALAQTKSPKRTVAKINVLSPFALTGSGFIEHAFSPQLSGQIGAFVTGVTISDVKLKGYGFTPEVRYYFSENKIAPAGPYLAGYARIQNFNLTVDNSDESKQYSATYKPVGAGVAVGNQWIFNSGLSLDLFFGAGYNGGSLNISRGNEENFDRGLVGSMIGSGFRIRPGIAVGYNF